MGAPARRYPVAAGQVFTGQGALRGFTIRETAGATAEVLVHDGTAANDAFLAVVNLAANGSATVLDAAGVRFGTGVFVEIESGAVEGSLFIG